MTEVDEKSRLAAQALRDEAERIREIARDLDELAMSIDRRVSRAQLEELDPRVREALRRAQARSAAPPKPRASKKVPPTKRGGK